MSVMLTPVSFALLIEGDRQVCDLYAFMVIPAIPSSTLVDLGIVPDDAGLCVVPYIIINSFVLASTKFSYISN